MVRIQVFLVYLTSHSYLLKIFEIGPFVLKRRPFSKNLDQTFFLYILLV